MKYSSCFNWFNFGVFAAAVIAFAGCTHIEEEDVFEYGTRPSDCLAFTVGALPGTKTATRSFVSRIEIAAEEWPVQTMSGSRNVTRAPIANHLDGYAGVIGFQYDEADGSYRSPIAGDDNNVEFEFSGDQLASTGTTILWKTITKANLNIYAYVPKVLEGLAVTSDTAPPKLAYIVPDDMDKQQDILISRWKSTEQADTDYKNKTIHLAFDHALTAVCFKVGFECKVKSVAINNVYNKGTFDLGDGIWTVDESAKTSYELILDGEEGVWLSAGADLIDRDDCFILMPQTLPEGAEIVLTCVVDENPGAVYNLTAPIVGRVWEPGKLITYTLHRDEAPETIYFDLALDNVEINGKTYSGKVFKDGSEMSVSGNHQDGNHYYVYQSTEANRGNIWKDGVCTPPPYPGIRYDGRPWSEFITDNTDVESVIEAWDKNHNDIVTAVGREWTDHRIEITGQVTCDLTIDNIYSIYQDKSPDYRITAGISFVPGSGVKNAQVTIKSVGDNRVGAVHYSNLADNGNEIIFEGTGSLTVADVDGYKGGDGNTGLESGKGYWSNHWSSAIGNHDSPPGQDASYGIVINSGIIFAGTTKAENCTAIGGGGNAYGGVTINGGTVTAVATTTGTAIGGGIGFGSQGGEGMVHITGGNVYAYNLANRWNIPSSAIGGAGSKSSKGNTGTVIIEGGYVYAYSALGTAIGGGSSQTQQGGEANVTITGGEVFAKTGSNMSASIGGGTACSDGSTSATHDGGSATITIYGNPIIRTGSIGGGGTGAGKGHIGNAKISIAGGDIQAQFLLSAGTGKGEIPSFEMTGGRIRNSNTDNDEDKEYLNVKADGGAVYLENGTVKISGGTIQNCAARFGGAIYIAGSQDGASNASFEMTGGTIQDNESGSDGGAIYIIDGTATLSGGTIYDNLAAGGNGGGIFMQRGSLNVDGATIQNNSAEIRRDDNDNLIGGNGGGIYVFSLLENVEVNLISGLIARNTADRKGAGVCVDMQNSDNLADVTIGTAGGNDDGIRIEHNHSLQQGGGIYARGSKAHITINSGTIMNNTVSQYVYNQDVANEQGTVVLNGGQVTHNEVRFHVNDGRDPEPEPAVQNIVTSTNSTLVAPTFTRTGYRFKGWNTKPSGKGDFYTNGQTMNIKADIDLYAQWEIAVTQ